MNEKDLPGSGDLANVEFVERKRGSTKPKASGSFLESLGIDFSQIQIQISLKNEDKELIQESIQNMSNDVKKYWTRTHILMVLIAVGSFASQVIL